MSYLNDTYITPTKDQLSMALIKVKRALELYKPISECLEMEVVEVKSWWGLRSTVMTKEEHIRKENENSFMPFYGRAFLLRYITVEEYQICRFLMEAPGVKTLQKWGAAERVYLCEDDHRRLMFALTEEI
jgi:hypothetical protein